MVFVLTLAEHSPRSYRSTSAKKTTTKKTFKRFIVVHCCTQSHFRPYSAREFEGTWTRSINSLFSDDLVWVSRRSLWAFVYTLIYDIHCKGIWYIRIPNRKYCPFSHSYENIYWSDINYIFFVCKLTDWLFTKWRRKNHLILENKIIRKKNWWTLNEAYRIRLMYYIYGNCNYWKYAMELNLSWRRWKKRGWNVWVDIFSFGFSIFLLRFKIISNDHQKCFSHVFRICFEIFFSVCHFTTWITLTVCRARIAHSQTEN